MNHIVVNFEYQDFLISKVFLEPNNKICLIEIKERLAPYAIKTEADKTIFTRIDLGKRKAIDYCPFSIHPAIVDEISKLIKEHEIQNR